MQLTYIFIINQQTNQSINQSMNQQFIVNHSGTIENLQHLGFTTYSAFGELIDNSNDAGAEMIEIGLYKWNDDDEIPHLAFYIVDDGSGMTKEKLTVSCCINNPQKDLQSFGDKSGRFGVGGSAALNVIMKKSGTVYKITKLKNSSKLFAIELNYNTDIYLPKAQNASREQEELWRRLSLHKSKTKSGTLIIGEIEEKIFLELHTLMNNKTVTGLQWYIATTFHRKIQNGLQIGIKPDFDNTNIHLIHAVDSSVSLLDDTRIIRSSNEILVIREKNTGSIRFGIITDVEGIVNTLPINARPQVNTKWIPLSLDLYDILGTIVSSISYSENWDEIHAKQNKKGNNFSICNMSEFRENTIVRSYIRSDRVIKSIPTSKRNQGDKASYTYYENVIHQIFIPACEQMDELFTIQLNKSQLDEKNINVELKKLIFHLSNVFSHNLFRNSQTSVNANANYNTDNDNYNHTKISSGSTDVVNVVNDTQLKSKNIIIKPSNPVILSNRNESYQPLQFQEQQEQQQQEQQQQQQPQPQPQPQQQQQQPVTSVKMTTVSQRRYTLQYYNTLYHDKDKKNTTEAVTKLFDDMILGDYKDIITKKMLVDYMSLEDKYKLLKDRLETSSSSNGYVKGGTKIYNLYSKHY